MTTGITNALQASFASCIGEFFKTPLAKQTIDSVLVAKLSPFFGVLETKYGINYDELVKEFKSCNIDLPAPETVPKTVDVPKAQPEVVPTTEPAKSPKKKTVPSKPKNPRKKASPKLKCQYVLTGRSSRKGQPCGKNCKAGEQYCGTHVKTQKAKLSVPPRKPIQNEPEPEQTDNVSITYNKFGNLQDPETFFVFKNGQSDPPIVFGKQDPETGKFIEITDKDLEYINEQGWKYCAENDRDTEVDPDEDPIEDEE